MRKIVAVLSYVVGALAAALSIPHMLETFQRGNAADAMGILSTLVSIGLAIAAMEYTYRTSEETAKLLERIEKQNQRLVDKINRDLTSDNFDEANVEDILDDYRDILGD